MKSTMRPGAVLGAAVALVLAGCAVTPAPLPPRPDEVQGRIESAVSRWQHESLVAYYTEEAAKARGFSAQHQRMARTYQDAATVGRAEPGMYSHCITLVQSYDNIAADYEAMAALHRRMAERAPQ